MSGRWPWLGHPLFLSSVAVLALNDHVLKLQFPSWWTGKLSDVAGVAVVGTLLSVPAGPTRGLAMTGLGFSLLKTVPGVAELAAPILGGVTARDATDLVALLVLAPLYIALHRRGSHGRATADPLISPAEEAELAAARCAGQRRRGLSLAAALPAFGALAAVLTATATSCGPGPAVTQVTAQDGSFYVLLTRGYDPPKWAKSDDGGQSWRPSAAPGQVAPSPPAEDVYADEPTGPTEACTQDGTCFRLRDRRVVEQWTPDAEWVEEARLSDAEFNSISTGCAGAQRGVLRSLAVVDRAGSHHAVASLGAAGVLVRHYDGTWARVRVLGVPPREASAAARIVSAGALLFVPVIAGLLALFGRKRYPSWLLGLAVLGAGWAITAMAAVATLLVASQEPDGVRMFGLVALLGTVVTTAIGLVVARRPGHQPPPYPHHHP